MCYLVSETSIAVVSRGTTPIVFLSVDDIHTEEPIRVNIGFCLTEIKLPSGICLPLFSKNTLLTPFSPSSLGIAVSLPGVNAAGT
jgi:hypothetical protein